MKICIKYIYNSINNNNTNNTNKLLIFQYQYNPLEVYYRVNGSHNLRVLPNLILPWVRVLFFN